MAESVKKPKAPAKPRAASSSTISPKSPAKSSARTAALPKQETSQIKMPTHEQIACLAQQYWAERGHLDGHAEQDWLRAEQELIKLAS